MVFNKKYFNKEAIVRSAGIFISLILFISCISAATVNFVGLTTIVPHPIFGTATWEGGGNAEGASVTVTSSLGTLTDIVASDGSWQVDCGDPGPDWPEGTSFTVTITGSGSHAGWSGSKVGTVSGYYNDMGNIIVYNDDPNTPVTPSGPTTLNVGESGTYSTSATDSGEQVQYRFDWGDGEISDWTTLGASGHTDSMSHSWSSPGTYAVKAQARDEHGATSGWSSSLTVTVSMVNNPPEIPSIDGPTHGKKGTEYPYSIVSIDPDGDMIKYIIDWGDGSIFTTLLYESGVNITVNHTWNKRGTYIVRVKAVDEHDAESDWATLKVSMPKSFSFILDNVRKISFGPVLHKKVSVVSNQQSRETRDTIILRNIFDSQDIISSVDKNSLSIKNLINR